VILYISKLVTVRIMFVPFETEPALCRGDRVYLVGLSKNLRAQSRKSTVTNPCLALYVHQVDRPRYGATNMEVIELDSGKRTDLNFPSLGLYWFQMSILCGISGFGSEFTGVLCDERGKARAIWGSFSNQVSWLICFS